MDTVEQLGGAHIVFQGLILLALEQRQFIVQHARIRQVFLAPHALGLALGFFQIVVSLGILTQQNIDTR